MRIVILGSGNIATFYGVRFHEAGHNIVQVLSPDREHASTLAERVNAQAINDYALLDRHADMYILGVRDDVLYTLAETLRLPGKLIVYGAGAVPLNALQAISERVICLWCMFSIQKNNLPTQRHFPVVYNTSLASDQELALTMAHLFSDLPYALSDEQKTTTHLSAVFVNNFTNHLYSVAHELMQEANIDFQLLHPMILDTALRISQHSPKTIQTGPAIRHDEQTIYEHRRLLDKHPMYEAIYTLLSNSIQTMYPLPKKDDAKKLST